MARGNANGRSRPYRGGKFRGGEGRGGNQSNGRGRGRGGGRGGYPNASAALLEEGLDFNIQMYANATPDDRPSTPGRGRGRGNWTPRGRGNPRRGYGTPGASGSNTPNRGRGYGFSPRGRGRHLEGIGASPQARGGGPSRPNTTLSNLLHQERPLLKPITFVPSVHSKILFQDNDDELLKAVVEDVDDTEQGHVPTADRVSRVFSGRAPHFGSEDHGATTDELEEIEEVDFNEVGKLFNPSATSAATKVNKTQPGTVEERFTGSYTSTTIAPPNPNVDRLAKEVEERLSTTSDDGPNIFNVDCTPTIGSFGQANQTKNLFFVDTQPTAVHPDLQSSTSFQQPNALEDDDDDIIVYVAPHPRHSSTTASADERDSQKAMSVTEDNTGPTPPVPDTSKFTPYVPLLPATTTPASAPTFNVPTFSSVSFSFASTITGENASGSSTPSRLRAPPVTTPRQAKLWGQKLKRASAKKSKMKIKGKSRKGRGRFGSFGAMREEALLAAALDAGNDPKFDDRRRGDSDLDWGDTDDEKQPDQDLQRVMDMLQAQTSKGKGKARATEDDHGMDIDSDLDVEAMQSFVGGMMGRDAGQHVTIDDLKDEEVMKMEDEQQADERGSSGEEEDDEVRDNDQEVEEVLQREGALLISKAVNNDGPVGSEDDKEEDEDEDDDDDDDDEDDDNTPRSSFQVRLERLRAQALRRKAEENSEHEDSDQEEEDDWFEKYLTKGGEDEAYIDEIEEMLDDNRVLLQAADRRRKQLFSSVSIDDFDDDLEEFMRPARRRKDKGKDLPPDLRAQWEKDRQKKAEYKKERELAKLIAAADPLTRKKGGKKARRAMQRAASLDPTIHVIPNRIIDMTTLVQQIERFIADVGGPSSMALPPTNKQTRKNIHEMAIAFNLKSVSKGHGDSRYTTLIKTTRTGFGADAWKIAKIVRRSGGPGALGNEFTYEGNGKRGGPAPKHKEGDEVGGAAPKLTESNVGFRLLAMMGWSEGDRIGSSMKGLDAPLTAIVKTSKRGLGAT